MMAQDKKALVEIIWATDLELHEIWQADSDRSIVVALHHKFSQISSSRPQK